MRLIPVLFALALAACGADGAPVTPKPQAGGVTITGEGRVGVTTTTN